MSLAKGDCGNSLSLPSPPAQVGCERRLRLLLVEDNAGDALLITSLLKEVDPSVEVHTVSDGQAALSYLIHNVNGLLPDAILLDINLPRKNGFEVLTEMRNQDRLRSLPVFMISGSSAPEDAMKGYALGVVSFITKPSGLSEFEELIKRFLLFDLPRALNLRGRAD